MAHQTINDNTLVESLFELFRSRGYEGATLALLSEVTGLKKSSLYHRFPAGKYDMAKAVVLHISAQLHNLVIEPLINSKEAPKKRFNNMVATIKAFYCDGNKNCILNVLSLGEAKAEINALLNKDYNDWLAALIKLGKEVGMNQQEARKRSERFLVAVQGALVIQRLTNNAKTFKNSMEDEQKLFFSQKTG